MKSTTEIIAILKSHGFYESQPPSRFVKYYENEKFWVEVWDWKIVSYKKSK